ncbi:AAA family ATPase [Streptomyces harbinensis]|uniref:AAA family ATPase n=1 Tax=Streptomyces harbinensis TaxID=1176198 RepID=UPI0015924D88|nr:AAA family ATPase [Streptomyces harbinensis]QKV68986.1 AAA family ATPase [Streptomyces harbinensis]
MTDTPARPPAHPGAAPHPGPADALLARLGRLRARVALLVEGQSADDPTAGDPMRGLYLPGETVRFLLRRPRLNGPDPGPGPEDGPEDGPQDGPDAERDTEATQDARPEREPEAGPEPGPDAPGQPPRAPAASGDRLDALAGRLGLTELDTAFLLIALAPDIDRTFEPLYGYLNDDVSRRRASIGLALDLCGLPAEHPTARARFHPSAPLTALGLLTVEDPERPLLSRALRVPDRVVGHLLGDDTPDPSLAGHLPAAPLPAPDDGTGFIDRLAGRLTPGRITYLREQREGDGPAYVAAAVHAAGTRALYYTGPAEGVPDILREARLTGHALAVPGLPDPPHAMLRALTTQTDVAVLVTDRRPYDAEWCRDDPLVLELPRPRSANHHAWSAAIGAPDAGPGFDLAATVAPYHLGGEQITRAARAAREMAGFDGGPLTAGHLRRAAQQQSASGLERHARRIRPDVSWTDLVLPEKPLNQLHELALRARHRDLVLGDWRLSAGGGRGRGVLALFAGDSGTGKTLSAEVVAAELGLDLYVIQLSSVVDKYVGETEKNLERIFTEADRTDAVLLFDEADSVFGKRSAVTSSNDRYANMESSYLLQRLESFSGIALLTTNLRANVDEAFTRRLDLVIDFPFPDRPQRLALWQHSLTHVPHTDGIELTPLSEAFELAGGAIRSAVVTAAYLAAGRGDKVTAADLLEGARREYRKAGRLVPGEGSW